MRIEDLDYELPPELIAQTPTATRESARLLVLDRAREPLRHAHVGDLENMVEPGDLLVVNETRVLQARVDAVRSSGGKVELLFLEPTEATGAVWYALLKAGGRLRKGEELQGPSSARFRLRAQEADGRWQIQVSGLPVHELLEAHGRMPLPPYIGRASKDGRAALDRDRYQTVYAREPGAIAAPTAGLHLGQALLDRLQARGVRLAAVTLHVGLGTFAPVRVADLDAHPMHVERYAVPEETAQAVNAARAAGRRVLAVGTTSVRALEAAALAGGSGPLRGSEGRTNLLIQPGYRFATVDALLTNFHLPRSTLLALVCAFAGRETLLRAYQEAIVQRYRFFSYGDAMLIL